MAALRRSWRLSRSGGVRTPRTKAGRAPTIGESRKYRTTREEISVSATILRLIWLSISTCRLYASYRSGAKAVKGGNNGEQAESGFRQRGLGRLCALSGVAQPGGCRGGRHLHVAA